MPWGDDRDGGKGESNSDLTVSLEWTCQNSA